MKKFAAHKKELIALGIILVLFIIKLIIIISFKDRDWEPDSYMHFLQLHTVYSDFPHNLSVGLSVWAKPLYSYTFGIIVQLLKANKLIIVQISNLLIFSLISYLVYKIVRKISNNYVIAIASIFLTSLSFLAFKSSVSALTEPIFTLMLVLNFYFLVNEKYKLASLFIGLSVLGRIEGVFFIAVYNIWLLFKFTKHKKHYLKLVIVNWLISVIPLIIWDLLGYFQSGKPFYLFDKGYPVGGGLYGFGGWLDFPKRLMIQEIVITLLFIFSIAILLTNFKKIKYKAELLLASVLFIGFTFSQMVFWVKGMFGSAGLMRYLVSVMPYAIIVGLVGFNLFLKKFIKTKVQNLLVVFLVLAQIFSLIALILGIGPLTKHWIKADVESREAGKWIAENYKENDPKIHSVRPEVVYYAEPNQDWNSSAQNYKKDLLRKKPGIYVWSKNWGPAFHINYSEISSRAKEVKSYNDNLFVFEVVDIKK